MGAMLLLRRFDMAAIRARPQDSFIDGVALLLLGAATTVVLLLLPVMMSWDFWLDRLDVPGLILLLTTAVVAVWGLAGLAQLGPALLYLLFAWPWPYLLVDGRIIPTMTSLTAQAVRIVAPLLPLGIRPDPGDPATLLITYHGHLSSLVVAQACAGVDGVFGMAIIGLPVALMARGSWEARGAWLLLGVALALAVNVVRIVIIAAAASIWGPDATMRLLHPELGLILFALSFALLLWLAPLCRLDVAAPWLQARPACSPLAGVAWGRKLVVPALIVLAGGLASANLAQYAWVSESTLPRVGLARADDLFHPPAGWRAVEATPIDDWHPIFGPSTVAAALTVSAKGLAPVYVQAVLTRDAATFRAYGVEDCYVFHGFTIMAVHRMALGSGVTATLVDFHAGTRPLAALYWLQPVQTPQGLYHERVILVGDSADAAARPSTSQSPEAPANPVQRAADALDEVFSPWFGGSAPAVYMPINARLQRFGQLVVAQERHG
jgi:exosortase/archaeosortase family protein